MRGERTDDEACRIRQPLRRRTGVVHGRHVEEADGGRETIAERVEQRGVADVVARVVRQRRLVPGRMERG